MPRLKELGISYEKARYWMAKAKGIPTDRHKPDSADSADEVREEPDMREKPAFDWNAAFDRLEALKNEIYMLKQSEPTGAGQLAEPLASLADLLGYELTTKKGEDNA
jgi:hypothetical protein